MIFVEYLTKPHNKWNSRSEPGEEEVHIKIEFGRDESGSSDDVRMERAMKFANLNVQWLTPTMSDWKVDCEELKLAFPKLEFPGWFQGTVLAAPILGHEARRSTTTMDGTVIRQGITHVMRITLLMMPPLGF